jgi:hypothetical protein
MVFGLTWMWLKPTIYHIQGKHTNQLHHWYGKHIDEQEMQKSQSSNTNV